MRTGAYARSWLPCGPRTSACWRGSPWPWKAWRRPPPREPRLRRPAESPEQRARAPRVARPLSIRVWLGDRVGELLGVRSDEAADDGNLEAGAASGPGPVEADDPHDDREQPDQLSDPAEEEQ